MTATKSRPDGAPVWNGSEGRPAHLVSSRSARSVSRSTPPGRFISAERWRLLAVVSLLAVVAEECVR